MKKIQLSIAVFGVLYCILSVCLFLIEEWSVRSLIHSLIFGVILTAFGIVSYLSKEKTILEANPKLAKTIVITSFVLAIIVFIFCLIR